MTMIEGVGDEVVQFVGVVLVGAVAALAWWSTNARPDRYRTVLVMRSRTHPVTVSIRTRSSNLMLSNSQTNTASSTTAISSSTQPVAPETTNASTSSSVSSPVEETPRQSRVIPLQEMDSIVDADMAMLDNNRLHFYRRVESLNGPQAATESASDDSETSEVEVEPASNAQIREMDSIVSAMEGDEPVTNVVATSEAVTDSNKPSVIPSSSVIAKSDNITREVGNDSTELAGRDTVDGNKIVVKLKYLNDTLKEVEGNLDEKLKDFKSRHFSTELSSECRVRLIFNGRVLVDDCATLRACGLHNRAVVHCLVHPKRTAQPLSGGVHGSLGTAGGTLERPAAAEAAPDRAWDLENILMTMVSVALTVVWFFRCEYSNMFTASASVALFGLTVFYSVAIFGLYLSDTFHFDRRPTPAMANNL